MTIKLYPDERLDDLQRSGYHIIQNPKKFCFGMDAVLLSGFAKAKPGDNEGQNPDGADVKGEQAIEVLYCAV